MLKEKFWKKYFQVYDILNQAAAYQELMTDLIEEADIKRGDVILDAGCGTGNFELWLKRKKPNINAKVIGLSNSPSGLEIYKEKIKGADVVLADLTEKLPFKDNYFDKIVSNNAFFTIHHKQRKEALQELKRVLKPGGKIVLANLKFTWSLWNIYIYSVKKEINKNGFLSAIFLFIKTFVPAMKYLRYNKKILKEADFGDFRCMDEHEQARKLEKVGFQNISDDKYVYAKQVIMNSAEK